MLFIYDFYCGKTFVTRIADLGEMQCMTSSPAVAGDEHIHRGKLRPNDAFIWVSEVYGIPVDKLRIGRIDY